MHSVNRKVNVSNIQCFLVRVLDDINGLLKIATRDGPVYIHFLVGLHAQQESVMELKQFA